MSSLVISSVVPVTTSLTSAASSTTTSLATSSSVPVSQTSTTAISTTQPITTQPLSTTSLTSSSSISSEPISTTNNGLSTTQISSTSPTSGTTTSLSSSSMTSQITSTTSEPGTTSLTSATAFSTSTEVSSDPGQGTVYSTTIVYISQTDSSGSVYATSSAISGGSTNSSGSGSTSKNNLGAIIGGTVGGVVGLAILATIGLLFWRRKKRDRADALDEKMFDPGRMARHSTGLAGSTDLVANDQASPTTISPFTQGLSSGSGYGQFAPLAASGAGLAYDRQHGRPTGGSADTTMYGNGSEAYLLNGGGSAYGNDGSIGRAPNSIGYASSTGHADPMVPNNNRYSGGWGVAAGYGHNQTSPAPRSQEGYNARDFHYEPYDNQGPPFASGSRRPVSQELEAYYMDGQDRPRQLSASAMAKVREANGGTSAPTAVPGHVSGPSTSTSDSFQREEGETSGRRSYRTSGSHGGHNLVIHDDAGPAPSENEDEPSLPVELPPTYNSVPRT